MRALRVVALLLVAVGGFWLGRWWFSPTALPAPPDPIEVPSTVTTADPTDPTATTDPTDTTSTTGDGPAGGDDSGG